MNLSAYPVMSGEEGHLSRKPSRSRQSKRGSQRAAATAENDTLVIERKQGRETRPTTDCHAVNSYVHSATDLFTNITFFYIYIIVHQKKL